MFREIPSKGGHFRFIPVLARTITAIAIVLPALASPAGSLASHAQDSSPSDLITIIETNLDDYPGGEVPQYEMFEVTFSINAAYENPYDPADVRVDGCFFPPGVPLDANCSESSNVLIQPGFYYQDYEVYGLNFDFYFDAYEVYRPIGSPVWKIRFTPREDQGAYKYLIRVSLDGGSFAYSPAGSFPVAASDHPGFIRVSEANRAYFEFDNGKPFWGVGLNVPFWEDDRRGISTYEHYFRRMQEYQANLVRMWMNNSVVEAPEDQAFKVGGRLTAEKILSIQDKIDSLGGDYNLRDAWAFDYLLKLAEDNGIYLLLTLEDGHQFGGYWNYNLYKYDPVNNPNSQCVTDDAIPEPLSGPECLVTDFVRGYQQRVYRYIVARWGYSPNILSWELYNEIDENVRAISAEPARQQIWEMLMARHAEMATYLKRFNAHPHLVNSSTGSFRIYPDVIDDPPKITGGFYQMDELDMAEVHFYYLPDQRSPDNQSVFCGDSPTDDDAQDSNPPSGRFLGRDMANNTRFWSKVLTDSIKLGNPIKPSLVGEFGLVGSKCEKDAQNNDLFNWTASDLKEKDDQAVHLHNGLWAGLMSGLASTPLHYHYQLFRTYDHEWWKHFAAIRNYFADVPLDGLTVMKPVTVDFTEPGSDPGPESFETEDDNLRAMGLRQQDLDGNTLAVFAWVQNASHIWWNYVHYARHQYGEYYYDHTVAERIYPITGEFQVLNLSPGTEYLVEWWDPYQTDPDFQITGRETIPANELGNLTLNVPDQYVWTDVALKIRPATSAVDIEVIPDKQVVPTGSVANLQIKLLNAGSGELAGLVISSEIPACNIGAVPGIPEGGFSTFGCAVEPQSDMSVRVDVQGEGNQGQPLHDSALVFLALPDGVTGSGLPSSCFEEALVADIFWDGGEEVRFNCGSLDHTQTIHLTETLTIDSVITFDGGAPMDSFGGVLLSGSNLARVFDVNPGATLILKNIGIVAGSAHRLEGFDNLGGGAIENRGELEISHSTFYANWADVGGALHNGVSGVANITDGSFFSRNLCKNVAEPNGDGGAIYNGGRLFVTDSTLANNKARGGGAIVSFNAIETEIARSTFVGNSAVLAGAIDVAGTGTTRIMNSTFSSNMAEIAGGAIHVFDSANAIISYSTLSGHPGGEPQDGWIIKNSPSSIISLDHSLIGSPRSFVHPDNCSPFQDSGILLGSHNIADDKSCSSNIREETDLNLDLLRNNGGFTSTHALLPESPALNQIPKNVCLTKVDQRLISRPQVTELCDIGAYEMIQLSGPGINIPEGDIDPLEVSVSLSYPVSSPGKPLDKDLWVGYRTVDGTAQADIDYVPAEGILVIPAGASQGEVAISIIGDVLDESDEEFHIELMSLGNAVLMEDKVTVTILDDDTAALQAGDTTAGEPAYGLSQMVFEVSLTVPSVQEISVDYQTVDGSALSGLDYQPVSGRLIFPAGAITKTIQVAILPDDLLEGDEYFILRLSNPVNAEIADAESQGTILDDDIPAVRLPLVIKN